MEATEQPVIEPVTPPVKTFKNWRWCALYVGVVVLICLCRIISVFLVPDVCNDENVILDHFKSILANGRDLDGNFLPWYSIVGGGYATYPFIYLMLPWLGIIGVSAAKARIILQLFTIAACLIFALAIKIWTQNPRLALISLLVTLTLPWGFAQANRVWDPALVPFYFSLYFLTFALAMRSETLKPVVRTIYFVVAMALLVLLATVYPACRIIAVVMWMVSVVWAWKKQIINWRSLIITCAVCVVVALPLIVYLFNPDFNARSGYLLTLNRNNWILEIKQYAINFLRTMGTDFLFVSGDGNPHHSLQSWGMLGTISIIPLVVLLRQKQWSKLIKYFALIIVVTVASVAWINESVPHALRTCLTWLPWSYLIAVGWEQFFQNRSTKQKIIWCVILSVVFAIFFATYIYESLAFK